MTQMDDLVKVLLEARRTGHRADTADLPSLQYLEALEVQKQVQACLGPVGGFKVARRVEGPPVIAPISAKGMAYNGSEIAVRDYMGIELEIGFEILADPVPRCMDARELYFRPRIVLELVDSRLSGLEDDPMLKLADMQINAGAVVGPALEAWDGRDFSTVTASLHAGDREILTGPATVPGGSALGNLALLLDHVGNHCGGLRAGHIVITGSLSGLPYFPAGTPVSGWIEGFGEVRCTLV